MLIFVLLVLMNIFDCNGCCSPLLFFGTSGLRKGIDELHVLHVYTSIDSNPLSDREFSFVHLPHAIELLTLESSVSPTVN